MGQLLFGGNSNNIPQPPIQRSEKKKKTITEKIEIKYNSEG